MIVLINTLPMIAERASERQSELPNFMELPVELTVTLKRLIHMRWTIINNSLPYFILFYFYPFFLFSPIYSVHLAV